MVFSPQGEYFASGSGDGKILVWKSNLETATAIARGRANKENVEPAADAKTPPILRKEALMNSRPVSDSLSSLDLNKDQPTPSSSSSRGSLVNQKETDDASLTREVLAELQKMNSKMETLTRTVLLMEKRITLVEDQVKLATSSSAKP